MKLKIFNDDMAAGWLDGVSIVLRTDLGEALLISRFVSLEYGEEVI